MFNNDRISALERAVLALEAKVEILERNAIVYVSSPNHIWGAQRVYLKDALFAICEKLGATMKWDSGCDGRVLLEDIKKEE